jgi:putative spermidine/putrescine transport system ATP-binding protein
MAVAIADFPAPLGKAPTLELRGVRKIFGDTTAVADLDLALCRGEFLTFLGPSGSGKTTTLAMVAGLEKPTAGTITLDGLPLDPLPAYRRNIGVVFQNYALFPHMTVAGNVAFPLEMRGVGRQEIATRVNETLTLVGLPGFGARYPAQLSGGQQQRVALARAIVFRPPLLLMDEPLGALDKRLREQMQIEIMRLHREFGLSVLYVTHDQDEALVMSDRIAVFNAGRIEQVGTAQELYERPQTPFVAGFLGGSNFFRGKVRAIE